MKVRKYLFPECELVDMGPQRSELIFTNTSTVHAASPFPTLDCFPLDTGGAKGQQNFPKKVTGCNSWGKKVLPFGALLLELPVDL